MHMKRSQEEQLKRRKIRYQALMTSAPQPVMNETWKYQFSITCLHFVLFQNRRAINGRCKQQRWPIDQDLGSLGVDDATSHQRILRHIHHSNESMPFISSLAKLDKA